MKNSESVDLPTCEFCEQPIEGLAVVKRANREFCCSGCATAHEMLHGDSGYGPSPELLSKYEHLIVTSEAEGLQKYSSTAVIWEVSLPAIHCTSCLILLERMPEWLHGVNDVRVSFSAKKAHISFDPTQISVPVVAAWLDFVGYPPFLITKKHTNNGEITKLGIAGFAMGNAMMSAFPEYFGLDTSGSSELLLFFRYSTAFFATLSLIVAGRFYLESAFKAIRGKTWSLDIPIAIGMIALWSWSFVLLIRGTSGGYFDSLSGLIFFLLLGKFFQRKTYAAFSFERTVNDFLPLSVFSVDQGQFIRIGNLKKGEIIELVAGSIVPVEATANDAFQIDYSFITGESEPVIGEAGARLLVGGKLLDHGLRATVEKPAQSSTMENIWKETLPDTGWVSPRLTAIFTITVLVLSVIGALIWWQIDASRAIEIGVSVLIIACPCALSLAAPFAYGTAAGIMSKLGVFLKSGRGVAALAGAKHIAWDKTGTLTSQNLIGTLKVLLPECSTALAAIVARSTHPVAQGMYTRLQTEVSNDVKIKDWNELPGKGICAVDAQGRNWFVGSGAACGRPEGPTYALCDEELVAVYESSVRYRAELASLLTDLLSQGIQHHLISGDVPRELPEEWRTVFGESIHFECPPEKKAALIAPLEHCVFIGDGLNDIEAMNKASLGLAVVEGKLGYFPQSDGILFAEHIDQFPKVLRYAKRMAFSVKAAYLLSLMYNLTGVLFALLGLLSPVFAAVLMPLSSITVVLFVVFAAWVFAPKI